MTETDNKMPEPGSAPPAPGESPRRDGSERRMALTAVVMSALALAIACAALLLQLRPKPEAAETPAEEPQAEELATIRYRNHTLRILEDVPLNEYDAMAFAADENGWLHYHDAPLGIDVSSYQGDVDWEQVAASGIRFAMIRAGLRGYTKGGLMVDSNFEQNIRGARAAGLDVGVYFFSQAVNVSEAEAEAEFLLTLIRDKDVTYPVVFDWERINDVSARTNGVASEEVTACAAAFCDKVAAAGYTPMIYFNMDQGYLAYKLDRLTDYAFWLAEYQDSPGFFYGFDFWQYTHRGSVPGIEGYVDLDLDLRAYARPDTPADAD